MHCACSTYNEGHIKTAFTIQFCPLCMCLSHYHYNSNIRSFYEVTSLYDGGASFIIHSLFSFSARWFLAFVLETAPIIGMASTVDEGIRGAVFLLIKVSEDVSGWVMPFLG